MRKRTSQETRPERMSTKKQCCTVYARLTRISHPHAVPRRTHAAHSTHTWLPLSLSSHFDVESFRSGSADKISESVPLCSIFGSGRHPALHALLWLQAQLQQLILSGFSMRSMSPPHVLPAYGSPLGVGFSPKMLRDRQEEIADVMKDQKTKKRFESGGS